MGIDSGDLLNAVVRQALEELGELGGNHKAEDYLAQFDIVGFSISLLDRRTGHFACNNPQEIRQCSLVPLVGLRMATVVGIVSSGWCDLTEQFGRLFKRAVGSRQALADEAEARGQKYLQAPGATAFISG